MLSIGVRPELLDRRLLNEVGRDEGERHSFVSLPLLPACVHSTWERLALRLAKRPNGRRVAPWPALWRRSASGSGSGGSPSRTGEQRRGTSKRTSLKSESHEQACAPLASGSAHERASWICATTC